MKKNKTIVIQIIVLSILILILIVCGVSIFGRQSKIGAEETTEKTEPTEVPVPTVTPTETPEEPSPTPTEAPEEKKKLLHRPGRWQDRHWHRRQRQHLRQKRTVHLHPEKQVRELQIWQ